MVEHFIPVCYRSNMRRSDVFLVPEDFDRSHYGDVNVLPDISVDPNLPANPVYRAAPS